MSTRTNRSWQMSGFGLSRLSQVTGRIPQPGPHELLVRTKAVSLNYKDRLIVDGMLIPDLSFPSCRIGCGGRGGGLGNRSAASSSGSACLARSSPTGRMAMRRLCCTSIRWGHRCRACFPTMLSLARMPR